ncbi:MAG: class I SAM-dependent rRNA methyltransferase [Myxococcales bacterium]|jgi:23S rRNA (cytosine1962-C5)-methyltransferase|nr:class I SAM-dependent rRNA methyltransferase [Myxococcales bacterium]
MFNVKLTLAKDLGRQIRAGHPWIFKNALRPSAPLPAGAIVDVVDGRDHFVARGYWDPKAAIAIRVLTLDPNERVDASFLRRRVEDCLALRQALVARDDTNAFRLIHGEGDGLPGVIVDLYAGFAVLKLYSAGLLPHRARLVEALRAVVPGLQGVIGRDDLKASEGELLWGARPPERLPILENGAAFEVDPFTGQKTGFFLDQRESRLLVRSLASNRSVLNCFGYTGGFSVNAAMGGATRVVTVDLDADAIGLARRNFELNAIDAAPHDFWAADVGDTIKRLHARGEKFGMVILDPPAYAKSQRAVDAALSGYAALNRTALALVEEGGILCTASCTARVSGEAFLDAIREAAAKADVRLQLLFQKFQPPDHPIALQFPEGRYLKFFVLRRIGA